MDDEDLFINSEPDEDLLLLTSEEGSDVKFDKKTGQTSHLIKRQPSLLTGKQRKRSPIWQYFVEVKSEGGRSFDRVKCCSCNVIYSKSCGSAMGNMVRHLKIHHIDVYQAYLAQDSEICSNVAVKYSAARETVPIKKKKAEIPTKSITNKTRPQKNFIPTIGEIAVYTDQFLNFNKERETELRRLRMKLSELDEEKDALHENFDKLRLHCQRCESELIEQNKWSRNLEKQYDLYRGFLMKTFTGFALSGHPNGISDENFDAYMVQMYNLTNHPTGVCEKIKEKLKRQKCPTL